MPGNRRRRHRPRAAACGPAGGGLWQYLRVKTAARDFLEEGPVAHNSLTHAFDTPRAPGLMNSYSANLLEVAIMKTFTVTIRVGCALTLIAIASSASGQTILFSDNFDVDSTASWTVNSFVGGTTASG